MFCFEGVQEFSEGNLIGLLQIGSNLIVLKVGLDLIIQIRTLELLFEVIDGCDLRGKKFDQSLFVGVLKV